MIHLYEVDYSFIPVKNGEQLNIGKTVVEIMDTPGHTLESTSFLVNEIALLTGDTLFVDGIGRPDLKSDKKETEKKSIALYDSLKYIKSLSENTLIFPAHVSKSIEIGQPIVVDKLHSLYKTIPSLNFLKNDFIKYISSKTPKTPPNYLTIAKIYRSQEIGNHKISELEAGANRCAIN